MEVPISASPPTLYKMKGFLVCADLLVLLCSFSAILSTTSGLVVKPEIYLESHEKLQYLGYPEAKDNFIKAKDWCRALEAALRKQDIFINVGAPKGATIILPCIYCGSYSRQEKYWFKTRYAWENPWLIENKTWIPDYHKRPYTGASKLEKLTGKPDHLYEVVQRKDLALVITKFSLEFSGLYSCYHNYTLDHQRGRITYNLDLLTISPTTAQGDYYKLLNFVKMVNKVSMKPYEAAHKFFVNTTFKFYLGQTGKCNGCGGNQGYKANLATVYLDHKESVPLWKRHRELSMFSSGIHVRSNAINRLTIPKKLQNEIYDMALEEFTFFDPCMNLAYCPDAFAEPLPPSQSVIMGPLDYLSSPESLTKSSSISKSLLVGNLLDAIKNRMELHIVKRELITRSKLECFIKPDEVAIWHLKDLKNKEIKLTGSVKANITKYQSKMGSFFKKYDLENLPIAKLIDLVPSSTGFYKFKNIREGDQGVYTCYGRNSETEVEVKTKQIIVVVVPTSRVLYEYILHSGGEMIAFLAITIPSLLLYWISEYFSRDKKNNIMNLRNEMEKKDD